MLPERAEIATVDVPYKEAVTSILGLPAFNVMATFGQHWKSIT